MASALKNLSEYDATKLPDIGEYRFGIVVADWNQDITHQLYAGCYDTLLEHGAREEYIHTVQVPGAFELTAGARILAKRESCDVLICLGCVIKGETKHDEYINLAVAQGLTNLTIATGRPHIYGVLTPNTHQQAVDRSGGKHGNKGTEAAVTAMRMVELAKSTSDKGSRIGFGRS